MFEQLLTHKWHSLLVLTTCAYQVLITSDSNNSKGSEASRRFGQLEPQSPGSPGSPHSSPVNAQQVKQQSYQNMAHLIQCLGKCHLCPPTRTSIRRKGMVMMMVMMMMMMMRIREEEQVPQRRYEKRQFSRLFSDSFAVLVSSFGSTKVVTLPLLQTRPKERCPAQGQVRHLRRHLSTRS
jgi:hypothetical protein